jgi:hypothetical protein
MTYFALTGHFLKAIKALYKHQLNLQTALGDASPSPLLSSNSVTWIDTLPSSKLSMTCLHINCLAIDLFRTACFPNLKVPYVTLHFRTLILFNTQIPGLSSRDRKIPPGVYCRQVYPTMWILKTHPSCTKRCPSVTCMPKVAKGLVFLGMSCNYQHSAPAGKNCWLHVWPPTLNLTLGHCSQQCPLPHQGSWCALSPQPKSLKWAFPLWAKRKELSTSQRGLTSD